MKVWDVVRYLGGLLFFFESRIRIYRELELAPTRIRAQRLENYHKAWYIVNIR